MTQNPERIFLVDSLGALLTAFLLAVVLTRFQSAFGMPANVLYLLASIAALYMSYSLCCYLFLRNKLLIFLKIIIIANLLYCCLTLGLAIYFYKDLTALGIAYFLIEIVVIIGLVIVEKRVYNKILPEGNAI